MIITPNFPFPNDDFIRGETINYFGVAPVNASHENASGGCSFDKRRRGAYFQIIITDFCRSFTFNLCQ